MKKGLVLEGGAMRGLFTAGVIDVLMEHEIDFDGLIGVSAGAAFGCNYKSRQIGRTIRYNMKYCKDWRYCSMRSLIRTGDLYGAEFCYHEIPEKLDIFDSETFDNNPMEFVVVCTDVETGKPVYHACDKAGGDCLKWIRASASMPMVSHIVEVGGYRLLDGGISDSIPLRYFEQAGYEKNVVVLTRPADYQKKKNSLMPLLKRALKKYPKVLETMENRHEDYNETRHYINERKEAGSVFVIQPDCALDIGRIEHDPEKMRRVYEMGRETALRQLKEIQEFLCS